MVSIVRGPTDGYQHRAYSFAPDGQTFVSAGSNGTITAYDLKGVSTSATLSGTRAMSGLRHHLLTAGC